MSTLAGTATVMGVFAILMLLFRPLRPAVIGALFALLNITLYVQARIAMLDGFMARVRRAGDRGDAVGDARAAGRGRAALAARRGAVRAGGRGEMGGGAVYRLCRRRVPASLARQKTPALLAGLGALARRLALLGARRASRAYFLTFLPAFFYATSR